MEEILHHIGLENLIDKFNDEGIDLMLLKSMTADDLKDLVPKVGPRIRLRNYLATIVVEFENEKCVDNYESKTNENLYKSEECISKSVSNASTVILDTVTPDAASTNCTEINVDTSEGVFPMLFRDNRQLSNSIIMKVNKEISDDASMESSAEFNDKIVNNRSEASSLPLQKKLTDEPKRFFF